MHESLDKSKEEESNPFGDLSEDEDSTRPTRQYRPWERSYSDFKVEIPKIEDELNPYLFLH